MVVGGIDGVVALMGFSYEEMYGHFAGTKKSGRNNEVVVRRGSTVFQSFILYCKYFGHLKISEVLFSETFLSKIKIVWNCFQVM